MTNPYRRIIESLEPGVELDITHEFPDEVHKISHLYGAATKLGVKIKTRTDRHWSRPLRVYVKLNTRP